MRAAVLGTGESGRAAAAALESDGCEVEVVAGGCDGRARHHAGNTREDLARRARLGIDERFGRGVAEGRINNTFDRG